VLILALAHAPWLQSSDLRPRLEVLGGASGQELGAAVALVADLDGDGYGEWLAARGGPLGVGQRPELLVLSGRDGALLRTLEGAGTIVELFFLQSLLDAGDVDGDGVHDLSFGNSSARVSGMNNVGRVTVFSGATGAILQVTDGVLSGGAFGASQALLGDLDGDGIAERVVGQIGSMDENVWVVRGSDGALLFSVPGPRGNDPEFGWSLVATGDLDGDGSPDFAAGTLRVGIVRYFSGADGRVLRSLRGGRTFGRVLADPGDVDGDGVRDQLIGESARQAVFLVSGRSGSTLQVYPAPEGIDSLAALGDLDGDGLCDFGLGSAAVDEGRGAVRILSTRSGALLAKLRGSRPGDGLGRSLAGGIDVDGDGFPDWVTGAPGAEALEGKSAGSPAVRDADFGRAALWSLRPVALAPGL